jgi:Tfp pilus assembly protein PilV
MMPLNSDSEFEQHVTTIAFTTVYTKQSTSNYKPIIIQMTKSQSKAHYNVIEALSYFISKAKAFHHAAASQTLPQISFAQNFHTRQLIACNNDKATKLPRARSQGQGRRTKLLGASTLEHDGLSGVEAAAPQQVADLGTVHQPITTIPKVK